MLASTVGDLVCRCCVLDMAIKQFRVVPWFFVFAVYQCDQPSFGVPLPVQGPWATACLQNHAWDQVDHIAHLEAMGQPMRGRIHIASSDCITRRAQGTLLEGSRTVICRVVRVQSGGRKPWQHTSYTKPSMNPRLLRKIFSKSSASIICSTCTRHLNKLCWRFADARLWTASVYLNWFHKYALISCGGGRRWTRPPEPFCHLSCIFTPYLAPLNQILACLPLWFPSGAEKVANKPKKNNNYSPKQPAWHWWLRAPFKQPPSPPRAT